MNNNMTEKEKMKLKSEGIYIRHWFDGKLKKKEWEKLNRLVEIELLLEAECNNARSERYARATNTPPTIKSSKTVPRIISPIRLGSGRGVSTKPRSKVAACSGLANAVALRTSIGSSGISSGCATTSPEE